MIIGYDDDDNNDTDDDEKCSFLLSSHKNIPPFSLTVDRTTPKSGMGNTLSATVSPSILMANILSFFANYSLHFSKILLKTEQ